MSLGAEQNGRVKSFFDQWKIYQKVMSLNYLSHREAYAVLQAFLIDHFPKPFSFLDLGCGDAAFTAKVLKKVRINAYVGVDLSENALKIAEENLAALECPKKFLVSDLKDVFRSLEGAWDFVWIGLSLHHLPYEEKECFLVECRKRADS